MTELLDDLGAHVDGATSLTLGSTLFLSVMPETPEACVALIETPSPAPVDAFGSGPPPVEMPRVQVLVRNVRPDTAKLTAREVWNAIANVADGTLAGGTKRWLRAELLQSPFLVGRDENDRTLYGFSVQVWKVP